MDATATDYKRQLCNVHCAQDITAEYLDALICIVYSGGKPEHGPHLQ